MHSTVSSDSFVHSDFSPRCIPLQYDKHFVPAWTYNATPGPKKTMSEAIKDITSVLEAYPRVTIIDSKPTSSEVGKGHYSTFRTVSNHSQQALRCNANLAEANIVSCLFFCAVYAEFESNLLGFVDDVEFFFQPDNETVEYRSASRLGEGDFDVNRKRIRDIRVSLQDAVR